MPDRVFSEEEVKDIIRRASARQEEEAERQEAREHGLTLADLEELGAEVGLDPKHLRAAADEVRTGHRTAVQAETTTDTHVIVECWVDGPFTPEGWEDTVALLRQRFGVGMGMWYGGTGEGRVEQIGNAHEWSHTSQMGVETRVSASEREGKTRLILSQRVGQASPKVEGWSYGAFLGLMVGLVGAGIGEALSGPMPLLVMLLALVLVTTVISAPIITRLDERWREKKHTKLKDLAAEVAQAFQAAAPPSEESAHTEEASLAEREATPRIDLDLEADERSETAPSQRNRTRS